MPEHRLKRLRYRAWHRGTREMDLVLGGFMDAQGESLSVDQTVALERMLEESDTDLYRWIVSGAEIPDSVDPVLIERLRAHASSLSTKTGRR